LVAIIAHGGAQSLAPENTLAAARRARALGADLWETDAALTSDGQVVLMHDDAMLRTTDVAEKFPDRVPAPFSTYTLAEIRTLDAGSWFERADPFGQVAAGAVSADELASPELDWRMNLELKAQPEPNDESDLVSAVVGLFPEDPIDFSDPFFGTFTVRITRVSLDEPRDVLARGIEVNAYTPDEPDEIAAIMAIGVTGIITDFPQRGGRP
jgi:glycerophosphoryl diester phosphodiesterase